MKNYLTPEELHQFQELGFVGPFKLIDPQDVDSVTRDIKKSVEKALFWRRFVKKIIDFLIPKRKKTARSSFSQETLKKNPLFRFPTFIWGKVKWDKGVHSSVPQIYRLSSQPFIVEKVASILGENILQWSSHIIDSEPSETYRWHGDVEHIEWKGLTVWVALTNVSRESSMRLISRSHNLSDYTYPQELNNECGLDVTQDDLVLQAAQKIDPQCELISVDMKPGEFFIFDGRIWHSARNLSSKKRTSMIFQYSPPSETIKIPITHRPPVLWKSSPPPCLLIRGKDEYGHNLIVPAPR